MTIFLFFFFKVYLFFHFFLTEKERKKHFPTFSLPPIHILLVEGKKNIAPGLFKSLNPKFLTALSTKSQSQFCFFYQSLTHVLSLSLSLPLSLKYLILFTVWSWSSTAFPFKKTSTGEHYWYLLLILLLLLLLLLFPSLKQNICQSKSFPLLMMISTLRFCLNMYRHTIYHLMRVSLMHS